LNFGFTMMVTNKKRINIIKYHYSGVHITQLAQLNGLISPYIKVGKVYIIRIFNAITQKFEPPEYDRQTDGRATANSERESEFTFAKN